MIEKFIVNKRHVYEEIAKTTSYAGAKDAADETAYDRVFTTDADRLMLERFWREACNAVTDQLKPYIKNVNEQPESNGIDLNRDYEAELELTSRFDMSLKDSIENSLFSFFVNSIMGKWYKFTNKDEVESVTADAIGMLTDAMRKITYKKKPEQRLSTTE